MKFNFKKSILMFVPQKEIYSIITVNDVVLQKYRLLITLSHDVISEKRAIILSGKDENSMADGLELKIQGKFYSCKKYSLDVSSPY